MDSAPYPVIDIGDPAGAGPQPKTLDEWREWVRRALALVLVGIFGLEVLGAMLALWFGSAHLQELKDILTLILGPTVALAGSAIGFYFGRGAVEPT
jgi:heme A synthase